jgi:hypothetical protein
MAASATTWGERIFDALVNRCRSGNLVLSGNAPACGLPVRNAHVDINRKALRLLQTVH